MGTCIHGRPLAGPASGCWQCRRSPELALARDERDKGLAAAVERPVA